MINYNNHIETAKLVKRNEYHHNRIKQNIIIQIYKLVKYNLIDKIIILINYKIV